MIGMGGRVNGENSNDDCEWERLAVVLEKGKGNRMRCYKKMLLTAC